MPRNPELNARMREKSNANILKATRKLFATRGYGNCKIQDVAEAAGMSTGNIYWYFKGKEDLLQAVLKEGLEAQSVMLEKLKSLSQDNNFYDACVEEYYTFLKEFEHFILIIISVVSNLDDQSFVKYGFDVKSLSQAYQKNFAEVKKLFVSGIKSKAKDAELSAVLVFAFFSGLIVDINSNWQEIPYDVIKKSVANLIN
ncbi:MAG: TetR/AcrR family transcriptional regulator [Spirochaetales bacterium]|nr:TetR/AcrR family transcriptional regulator [Spirochaetales bacterium]